MTFFSYFSGLIAIIIIGVGIALMYIEFPDTIVHLDIRRPNLVMRALGLIIILGGVLSLGGSLYSAIRDWREGDDVSKAAETGRAPPAPAVVPPAAPQPAPRVP